MPDSERNFKVVKKADINLGEKLKESARLAEGQVERTNNLFVETLLDVIERTERIESWAQARGFELTI